jgi:aminoglycoside 3-N-acetyltransferase I
MEIIRLTNKTLDLAKDAARLFYGAKPETLINERFFNNDSNIMYVAVEDGKVIGNVYGYILQRFDMPKNQLFLYSIDVLDTHQKKGIGKALVYAFLTHMNKKEIHNAFVLTNKGNASAMKLYQSTGAEIITSGEGEDILFKWTP